MSSLTSNEEEIFNNSYTDSDSDAISLSPDPLAWLKQQIRANNSPHRILEMLIPNIFTTSSTQATKYKNGAVSNKICMIQKNQHHNSSTAVNSSSFKTENIQSVNQSPVLRMTSTLTDYECWDLILQILTQPSCFKEREKRNDINTLHDLSCGLLGGGAYNANKNNTQNQTEKVDELPNDVNGMNQLKPSQKILVLTGAGVSVSCGIPDFRSRDGLYARLADDFPNLPDPQAMFDIDFFKADPRPFFKFAKEIFPGQFEPSLSHLFIRWLEINGKLLRNYTQNIDTLERIAGIQKTIECHGSFATASCIECKYQVDSKTIKADIFNQKVPICPVCNENSDKTEKYQKKDNIPNTIGSRMNETNNNNHINQNNTEQRMENHKSQHTTDLIIQNTNDTNIQSALPSKPKNDICRGGVMKPDIVFFGEGLDAKFHMALEGDKDQCDLLIIMGSSMKVRPVSLIPATLPTSVPQILINKEPLPHITADIELLGDSDLIVSELFRRILDPDSECTTKSVHSNEPPDDILMEQSNTIVKKVKLEHKISDNHVYSSTPSSSIIRQTILNKMHTVYEKYAKNVNQSSRCNIITSSSNIDYKQLEPFFYTQELYLLDQIFYLLLSFNDGSSTQKSNFAVKNLLLKHIFNQDSDNESIPDKKIDKEKPTDISENSFVDSKNIFEYYLTNFMIPSRFDNLSFVSANDKNIPSTKNKLLLFWDLICQAKWDIFMANKKELEENSRKNNQQNPILDDNEFTYNLKEATTLVKLIEIPITQIIDLKQWRNIELSVLNDIQEMENSPLPGIFTLKNGSATQKHLVPIYTNITGHFTGQNLLQDHLKCYAIITQPNKLESTTMINLEREIFEKSYNVKTAPYKKASNELKQCLKGKETEIEFTLADKDGSVCNLPAQSYLYIPPSRYIYPNAEIKGPQIAAHPL